MASSSDAGNNKRGMHQTTTVAVILKMRTLDRLLIQTSISGGDRATASRPSSVGVGMSWKMPHIAPGNSQFIKTSSLKQRGRITESMAGSHCRLRASKALWSCSFPSGENLKKAMGFDLFSENNCIVATGSICHQGSVSCSCLFEASYFARRASECSSLSR